MAGGELLGGAGVEDQDVGLGGGGGEGVPVDQPRPAIRLDLGDQRPIAVIIDLRVERRGRAGGGDRQGGEERLEHGGHSLLTDRRSDRYGRETVAA